MSVILQRKIVEKPWGKVGIPTHFTDDAGRQIGEIWFEAPDGRPLDVMAKYLFTTERLSIQVHPDDPTARARGHDCGKTECWLVLHAEPGAELGIGTVREVTPAELMDAARDGSIVDLIDWRQPKAGDFIYNPAGTVHALGPGLTVLEIQQSVDLTYRLFDYGRPRDLHLDESADVVVPKPHYHPLDTNLGDESQILTDGPCFGAAWCVGGAPRLPDNARDIQLLPIDVPVDGVEPGHCALIDRDKAEALSSNGRFVLAWSVAA